MAPFVEGQHVYVDGDHAIVRRVYPTEKRFIVDVFGHEDIMLLEWCGPTEHQYIVPEGHRFAGCPAIVTPMTEEQRAEGVEQERQRLLAVRRSVRRDRRYNDYDPERQAREFRADQLKHAQKWNGRF